VVYESRLELARLLLAGPLLGSLTAAERPVTLRWVRCGLTIAMDLYSRAITGLRLSPVSTKSVDAALVLFEACLVVAGDGTAGLAEVAAPRSPAASRREFPGCPTWHAREHEPVNEGNDNFPHHGTGIQAIRMTETLYIDDNLTESLHPTPISVRQDRLAIATKHREKRLPMPTIDCS
jgi:hypothetical protein